MSSKVGRARSFSIELNSGVQVKRVSFSEGKSDCLMIEGFIGELTEILLVEDILLEIKATGGVLRIDLSREELKKSLRTRK